MTYYIYRLPAGGREKRGLDGLIHRSNPHLQAYFQKHTEKQSLYIEVGDTTAPHTVLAPDVESTREYSAMFNVQVGLVARLLTVRTEWSRK